MKYMCPDCGCTCEVVGPGGNEKIITLTIDDPHSPCANCQDCPMDYDPSDPRFKEHAVPVEQE